MNDHGCALIKLYLENRWQVIFGPQVIVFQPCYIEGDSQILDLNSRTAIYQICGLGYAPV
jgi:hypothetical protein